MRQSAIFSRGGSFSTSYRARGNATPVSGRRFALSSTVRSPVERKGRPRLEFAHGSARRAAQRRVALECPFRLYTRRRNSGHVVKPAIHRLAHRLRVAVVSGPDEESYILLGAEQVLERLQSTEGLLESARVKKIFLLPHQNHRLRCHRSNEVREVESEGEHAGRTRRGVGGVFVFEVAARGRDEAARRRHREPRFQRAQPRRLRATAGVARDADVP
jgi:hypothetical protein